jgi:hypothetical protein
MLSIILAIIEVVSKLVGPAAELFKSVHQMWADWHSTSGVTPDSLSNDAIGAATALANLGEDTQAAINDVSATLARNNPGIDPAHATAIAAMAVQHVQAQRTSQAASK